ncbi:hypothetical protein CROQUDRAFT_57792 [Cronartium quercuum f. sp. fusiforme G11]|uniref:Tyrosinase copper-binding domain-containing protein n=1 Tax=Cronartium quercuum f. sp. fusiforme G11 TaxID=708437 RepID=A0A9P6TG97_9BASI|nr:hypothetical protein CROQUDRAFT_57792 [Cronartium quercuum f. sp. fusiforme G11]
MLSILSVLWLGTIFSLFELSTQETFYRHRHRQLNSTIANRTFVSDSINSNNSQPQCKNLAVRREWRTLSREYQEAYINAVKCLTKRPSKLLGRGYRRFDDFQYVHCEMRSKIHFTAMFFVWHHKLTQVWETTLQEECGYRGALPYWQWELDAENFPHSPIWSSDPVVGFGTNGANFSYDPDNLGGGIVTDGAFAYFQILYPERQYLERNFHVPSTYVVNNQNAMSWVLSHTDYASFSTALEGSNPTGDIDYPGPHGMLHAMLGGDMPKLAYAANDVVFWVLHCNVDRLWWEWIRRDPAKRMMAYGGNRKPGSFANDASLDDELDFLGLTPKVKVRDVMKWATPPFCYTYE